MYQPHLQHVPATPTIYTSQTHITSTTCTSHTYNIHQSDSHHIYNMYQPHLQYTPVRFTPYLQYIPVISSRYQIWFVTTLEIINAVDSFFMSFQRKIRSGSSQLPYLQILSMKDRLEMCEYIHFDGTVKRGTGKLVVVLWVEHDHHDIVGVSLKDL